MRRLLVIALVSAGTAGGYVLGQAKDDMRSPYTPTRLEWMAVECNAFQADHSAAYTMRYAPSADGILVILVDYERDARAELLDQAEAVAKKLIAARAELRGWDVRVAVKRMVRR